jgi:hypothetical protein
VGPDTEHAPAARVVDPPGPDVAGKARAATAQTSGSRSTPAGPSRPPLCDSGDNRDRVGALADRLRESPAWEELQQWTDEKLRDLREHFEGTRSSATATNRRMRPG